MITCLIWNLLLFALPVIKFYTLQYQDNHAFIKFANLVDPASLFKFILGLLIIQSLNLGVDFSIQN